MLSAFGTLVTPLRLDLVRGALRAVRARLEHADDIFSELVERCTQAASPAPAAPSDLAFRFGADMRYFGQQNEVTAWFETRSARRSTTPPGCARRSSSAYEQLYSLRLPEVDVEIVSWRLAATGPGGSRDGVPSSRTRRSRRATRKARFHGNDVDAPVYERRELALGQSVAGPAIIEERETTIVICPAGTRRSTHRLHHGRRRSELTWTASSSKSSGAT